MKWVIGVIIFMTCFLIGAGIYRKSAAKVKFYTGLITFCNNLNTEIGFQLTPMAQIITQYKNSYSSEFNQILSGYLKLLEDKTDITREKCLELTPDSEVADFLLNLGRAGSQEEIDKIKTALEVFTKKKADAETYLKSKASIIFKLLIIIGIAGVILWI